MKTKRQDCIACGGPLEPWFRRGKFVYLRCAQCRSVVTDPIPSQRQILSYYRSKFLSGNYLLLRQFARQYLSVYAQFVEVIRESLMARQETISGKSILDVGCFTADFLELMEDEGARVYGTELQKEALALAQAKFPGRIFQADISTTKFPRLKFEIVTLLGLIEHVTEPHQLLSSVQRLTRPGSLLVIQTPDSASWPALVLGKWWPPLAPVEHIHIFSSLSIKLLLTTHGFTDIKVRRHIKPLPVAYVYGQFSTFGHHFGKLLAPLGWLLSRLPAGFTLPFYGGEMIVTARRR